MQGSDSRELRVWTHDEMLKRVARFEDLTGSDGGRPDSDVPECRRTRFAVIGSRPRADRRNEATASPVGDKASATPAIRIAEGLNPGCCKAMPGKGPLAHNHDTNETFVAMSGRWRCEWNEGEARESVDLEPLDVVSFPVGVARRFMNVTYEELDKEHDLMFVIGGNEPQAEFTPQAMRRCEEWQAQKDAKGS
ncbi:MAG: cupin domain-containing protein [Burkholderiales bacterium]|nr:cupin domain-containing protein [Burkholderiales bacterium]